MWHPNTTLLISLLSRLKDLFLFSIKIYAKCMRREKLRVPCKLSVCHVSNISINTAGTKMKISKKTQVPKLKLFET